jgi:hypothetical protein
MSTGKRYKIDSFEKLLNVVTEENIELLATDLGNWMCTYLLFVKEARIKYPKETEGKTNSEIFKSEFEWIDDGKNDLKEVVIINNSTGETQKIVPENKKD